VNVEQGRSARFLWDEKRNVGRKWGRRLESSKGEETTDFYLMGNMAGKMSRLYAGNGYSHNSHIVIRMPENLF
jgi:hypothetical protein